MEIVLADIQSDLNSGITVDSSYTHTSSGSDATMPADQALRWPLFAGHRYGGCYQHSSGIQIGAYDGLSTTWQGTISEVLVFNRVLSSINQIAIYNTQRGCCGAL